jgi:hypothetical protein
LGEVNMSKSRYAEMLKSERWQETRARVNNYSPGRCESCGCRTNRPQVHHREYHGDHPSDTGDDFLMSLCPECHYETHWIDRLRAYSAEKKRLRSLFVDIDYDMHQELKKRFNV